MEDLRKNYASRIQADVAGGDGIYQAFNKVKLHQRIMQVSFVQCAVRSVPFVVIRSVCDNDYITI